MWVENGNLKATIPNTGYGRLKTPRECGIFKDLGSIITNNARSKSEIKSRIAVAKQHSTSRRLLHHQIEIKFKEETRKVLYLEQHFEK
jgi:hypothetical protein